MTPFAQPVASVPRSSIAPTPFVSELLLGCLDIRSLWSLDHSPGDTCLHPGRSQLLAFADLATLRHLRMRENLHRSDVELLVVVDGDGFESAWGPCRLSGSLSRWAWRQISAQEAYYEEARWDQRGHETGNVVRLRRKALLLWQQPLSVAP
jgi:hypothetical protein